MPTKSKISTNEITIHQCLHGYENGHTLLSSSLKLEHSLHSTLLVLSDLSGSGVVNGFESYLTGYPLGENLYAFARTWYASEMPRPGCVWTHTLILPSQIFAETKSFDFLLKYFIHPKESDDRENYSNPISIMLDNEFLTNIVLLSQKPSLNQLQASLYSHPANTLLLPADTALQYEPTLLALWALQWPALRQNFKFCSGSFSPRKVLNENFDIEVIPKKIMPTTQRKWVEPHIFSFETETTLFGDLDHVSENEFISFLLSIQKQIPGSRDNFIPVRKLYDALSKAKCQVSGLQHLVKTVGMLFPKSDQALGFKEALFLKKPHSKSWGFLNEYTTTDVLLAIVESDCIDAFSGMPNFGKKLKEILLGDSFSGKKLLTTLIAKNENLNVRTILKNLSKELTPSTFQQIAQDQMPATFILLSLNPFLLENEVVWKSILNESQKRELVSAIISENPNDELLIKKLIRIAIAQKADYLARDFYAKVKEITINTLFEVVSSSDEQLRCDWISILKQCQQELIFWATKESNKSGQLLEILSQVIDIDKVDLSESGSDFWLSLWNSYSKSKNGNDFNSRVNIFLLGLGFKDTFPDAYKIIESVFLVTHKQLSWKEIEYEEWVLLEDKLPSLGPFRNWDKCERLRMALVKSFDIHSEWPLRSFLNACLESSAFQEVLKTIKSNNKSRFLNRLIAYIKEDSSNVPSWQQNLILSNTR